MSRSDGGPAAGSEGCSSVARQRHGGPCRLGGGRPGSRLGRLSATTIINWTQANRTIPFQQFPNIQNINEARLGIPTERGTIRVNYAQGPLSFGVSGRYVSRTALFNRDATRIEFCESLSPCQIKAKFYTDVDFNYKLATRFGNAEIYGGVKNIANTKIPLGGFSTTAEYEIFGTTGFIGFRIKE